MKLKPGNRVIAYLAASVRVGVASIQILQALAPSEIRLIEVTLQIAVMSPQPPGSFHREFRRADHRSGGASLRCRYATPCPVPTP